MERGGPGGLVCDLLALLCVACMSGFGLGIGRGGGGGGSSRPSIIAGPVDPLRRRRLALVDPRWGPVSSNRPKVRGTPPSPSETPSNKAGMVTGGGWRVGVPWCGRPDNVPATTAAPFPPKKWAKPRDCQQLSREHPDRQCPVPDCRLGAGRTQPRVH